MADKPTYEDLEKRVQELEKEIYEHREVESALDKNEKKFRLIVENANEGIVIAQDGLIRFANPKAQEMIGYPFEELEARPIIEFIHPDDRDLVFDRHRQRLAGEPVPDLYTFRLRARDGRSIWVEIRTVIIDWAGRPATLNMLADISERKRVEEALRQSEESYRKIMEMAPDAIAISRVEDGRYLQVNEAFCRMTGYRVEEVIGRTVFELNLYIDRADRDRLLEPLRRQAGVDGLEFRYRVKDGTLLNTLVAAKPIRFQGEECLLVVVTNIDSFKKAQQALFENQQKYRHILESMEEGYYEVDLAGNRTFFNEALCTIYGYTPDEMMGMNYRQYMPPESRKKIKAIYNQVYRTGIPNKIVDYEVTTKMGSVKMLETSVSLLKNSAGEPAGFYGISRDVTERKENEKALRESEEKYRLLVENAHDGIYITQEGVVRFANPKMEGMTGYSTEDLASRPFLHLVHPKDKAAFFEREQKKPGDEQGPETYTFRMINSKAETLWMELTTVPIAWEGRPATLNFLRDITPQKKMEAQFLQAQKMEAVGTLAGGIAHDFNNLLMGIQGNASLVLLDLEANHPHYGKLRSIEQLVQGGADLTRQLLGVARGGKYEVKPADINKLVAMSVDLFGRTKKEISIHKKLQEAVWTIDVDRSQIEQVLLNLYVNAWQAMPEGGDLFLETRNVTLDDYYVRPYGGVPGRYVRISVTDTGIGMDEATRKRVFDPFFTTKDMGRGTGLGLASAYGIIRNHSGIINVYSEKGEGTTFNIYFPVSAQEIKEEAYRPEEILQGVGSILFVDDEKAISDVSHFLLKRLGYRVITAGSGREAIEIYRREGKDIDLVILDMIMPEMSGGETFSRLKEIDPNVKVLLSSGYSLNGQAKSILDQGCKGFLQKPFNLADLSKKVRQILEEGRGDTPPA
ncbi:MAG: PAS domain S-box protein [Deltaproteobacteria bacterium]|nr:PAS domain S-box protein [Deltaproteobacteria bacterium]